MNEKALANPNAANLKALYEDVWGVTDELESGLDTVKIDVSVMLSSILEKSGISRGALAKKLKCAPSRVTRALSGDVNLTLKSIYEICHAAGFTFDLVVRKANEPQALQPWQKSVMVADIIRVHKTLNHRLTEAEAILSTAKALSRRQFAMSTGLKNMRTMKFTETLAANDANTENAAVTG